ncbi:hypothetical protein [Flexivirga endophytica]|uniref:hypothetical protein n=1 Tax=Flexivirga endophytica TaxID=1849103 RepID=UPI0016643B32|nr:hypothetical protein [Flexivirga endophytica]
MPSTKRSRSAVAVIDVEIADRAATRGLDVSPGTVRRWRLGGLLPDADAVGDRPVGARAGRRPQQYTAATLVEVEAAIDVLIRHTRRGRSQQDLALILFAHHLPVRPELVRAAITVRLHSIRLGLDDLIRRAQSQFPSPADAGLELDDTFERAEALAQLALAVHPSPFGRLRRNLKKSGQPVSTTDMLQIATCLFQILAATQPGETSGTDVELWIDLMRALGMDGMLESATADVPPLLPQGVGDFLDAASGVGQLTLRPLPVDLADDELFAARDLAICVAQALRSISDPTILHHLGGPSLATLWDPSDPTLITTTTTLLVHMLRSDEVLDPYALIEARDQG